MDGGQQRNNTRSRPWVGRLDRAAGELNAFLLVLAIGLAMLDFTCFCAFKVRDALPAGARAGIDPALVTRFQAVPTQSAALTPTRPGAAMTGW